MAKDKKISPNAANVTGVANPDAALDAKIRNYIVLNLLGLLVVVIVLDMVGVISLKKAFYPVLAGTPGLNRMIPQNLEDPYLLSQAERKKEVYSLRVLEDNLKKKEQELKERETMLKSTEDKLSQDRDQIEMLRKDFEDKKNEYKNYQKNIAQQAEYIESMRPEDAVDRLQQMDDMTVIDILREVERKAKVEGRTSVVSYLLTKFEPKRASIIQKKMLNMDE
jgi:flagellar motility protein MotE (MotC chaperone)